MGDKFKFLSTENALPWGLSFGYAYAGSVAMLAAVFNDITTVMITGHIIALLTITWMQRSVLVKILDQHDLVVSSTRKSQPATASSEVETVVQTATESEETEMTLEQNIEVEWDGNVGPSISEDVEWDDVIELKD